jgi:hypothetical protein
MPDLVRLIPVPGRFLNGIPAVEHDCDEAEAIFRVQSGAFTYAQPPATAAPQPPKEKPSKPNKE